MTTAMREVLLKIKAHCVGDMLPNWNDGDNTYASRRYVADLCDAAIAAAPDADAQGLPPLPEQAGWAVVMHGAAVLFSNNAEKEIGRSPGATTKVFTADQMRAYAIAARSTK